ncbi:metallophosphoesterase family protein [Dactylosporangium sp. NPDC051541]|uniref:metallophosphoesterase family protein n=1 Tax=Dactylosporangium sp. NPDC051541 TaxID=3363977 RepID=UPI0037A63561
MRVAVLADVHANLPALEAVLDDVDACGADRIVLLGDIAGGPLPAETLDRLAALGDRAVWVHGNGERELVDAFDGKPGPGPIGADAADCAALLEQRHRDLLAGRPLTVTLGVDGLGPVLFCHATPRRDDEFVLVDSPIARWNAVLDGVATELVVCGHTHMPFDRLADRRRVVNPGSVGMNYGPAGAYWALLGDGAVQLRRTAYDAAAAAARIVAGRHPRAAWWAEHYVTNPYSDADALTAFAEFTKD